MVDCRCPYCGHVQAVDVPMVGQSVGCMSGRCHQTFVASPDRRHTGTASRIVFSGVILFAALLLLAALNPKWNVVSQWTEWVKR
jgi:hypothetical protein